MANQLYALGPKDGTAIGVPLNGTPAAPLLQPRRPRISMRPNSTWLGSSNREPYVAYVWHSAPVQTLAALLTTPLVVGATTPGTTMNDFPQLTNAILGTKFKIVRGYESTPQMNQAMERGETEGVAALGWNALVAQGAQWLADKKVKVIAQFGLERSREFARRAADDRPRQVGARPPGAGDVVRAHRIRPARISCRRMCRPTGSRRCGAPSTPP